MNIDSMFDGAAEIEAIWLDGLMPDPLLSVSEWADEHRVLSSRASAEPGKWRTSRTPYLREIMNCLSPHSDVERVVFMKGAQVGGTEAGNNWIGYVIAHSPGPMMAVSPTVDMAKRSSKQRIDSLIEESPVLAALVSPSRSRDAGNTILSKEFRGGILVMTGANSAVGLRSMPVRFLFCDEVDGYPSDVENEGDAISLAEARTRTFARRKIFIVSAPTISGASAIEREYQASDQRRYFVPCPNCMTFQHLQFEQLRWQKGQHETVGYVCQSCEMAIGEHHKTWMLERGEWHPTVENYKGRTAGFHLSSLYSPLGWRSWRDIAAAWESANDKVTGSEAARKTFVNTELGECWVEQGEVPQWERLLERAEDYRVGTVPEGGLLLTAGVDVQKDRIEVSVWAFGRGKECWLVEHRVLAGDTGKNNVWSLLGAMLAETWQHASGASMPLVRIALDTGYASQEAYTFVRAQKDNRLVAIKGVHKGAALVSAPRAIDVSIGGKRLRAGIKLVNVVSGIAKSEFYSNLNKTVVFDEDGAIGYPAGYVHLPKTDAEYVQQLTAEQLVTRKDRNGYQQREWQKMRDRNEALDCYVYARAAAALAGLDRFEERHWRQLEQQLEQQLEVRRKPKPDAVIPTQATPNGGFVTSGGRRIIRSQWMEARA